MVRLRGVINKIVITFLIVGGTLLGFQRASAASGEYMSWGIEKMGLDKAISAIDEKGNAPNILVAVIDTGVNEAVFRERFPDRNLSGYCVAVCEEGMIDKVNQGTHTIGTIAEGTSDNVDLLMIRVSDEHEFSLRALLTAIDYAISQGADVIDINAGLFFDFDDETYNEEEGMTWGEIYQQAWQIEKDKIDEAVAAGAIVVSIAGNDGESEIHYPASYDNVISASAAESNLEIANFSNHNEHVDFAAPGAGIMGLNASYGREGQGPTTQDQGTASAAAHLTAAVADILSFNKDLSFDEMMELLKSKAVDLGETGKDEYYGNGFVDFSKAAL